MKTKIIKESATLNRFLIKNNFWIFLVLFTIACLFLDVHKILFYKPQGIHFIRQTDCLSFVDGYKMNGMKFFQPCVYNLKNKDGKAACEFPLLYYLTAALYLFFGEHEWFLRFINTFIVFAGFYSLMQICHVITKDWFYSFALTFLFFSSTVLIYYTVNFLPDAPSLGFTLLGLWFMLKYYNDRKNNNLVASFVFFSLASLIKITYFIYPASIVCTTIIQLLFKKKIFKQNYLSGESKIILLFFICFVVVAGWNFYMLYYNKVNNSSNFLTKYSPIWEIDSFEIRKVWNFITHYWYSKYYYESLFHLIYVFFFAGLVFARQAHPVLFTIFISNAIGGLFYFLLFYAQFKDHDYYFIAFIPALISIILNTWYIYQKKYNIVFNNYFSKTALLILVLLSLNYVRLNLNRRYQNSDDIFSMVTFQLSGVSDYLVKKKVPINSKIIVLPDYSNNGGLYFAKRKGWTIPDTSSLSVATIKKYINEGAEYLLLLEPNLEKKCIENNIVKSNIGTHNSAVIYKLKN